MNVNIFRFILCCFLILAFIGLPVSARVCSVVVDSCQVTPAVMMPGENGTVTVTIQSTAAGSQSSTVSYPESGFSASSATTTVFVPCIDSVILSEEDIRVLGSNGQFEGYVGPDQIIPLTFLIEAPGQSGLYFPDVLIRLIDGKIVPE